jgi:hypothetical protein
MIALIVPGVIVLLALGAAAGLTYGVVRARNRLKLIEAAPLCKADQLITGLAKMRGKIVALDEEDLLKSPMTKTVCVYYRFIVQEQRTRTVSSYQGGRHVTRTETYWHTLVDDVQAVPTTVQDKTGEALVDLKAAELTLKAMQATSGTFKNVPASLERTLQRRYGVSGKGFIFNKNMRYTESVIKQGAKVFVVGDCKVRKNGTASFFRGDNPLLVTDRNEQELVGHYKTRFIGFLIAAILVPLFLVGLAGVVGFFIWKTEKAVNPPHNNQQAQQNPQNPQNPQPADELTTKINDLKNRGDKWARARAANDLAFRVPVQAARRDEVAQALNDLLNDADKDVRSAGISAAKVWGTRRHNEAALKKLAGSQDVLEKQAANEALTSLAP